MYLEVKISFLYVKSKTIWNLFFILNLKLKSLIFNINIVTFKKLYQFFSFSCRNSANHCRSGGDYKKDVKSIILKLHKAKQNHFIIHTLIYVTKLLIYLLKYIWFI